METDEFQWAAMLDALADALAETGAEGWLVGGCLRDALLSKPVRDVDVTITGELLAVAERMAQRAPLVVARLGHGTIRLSTRRLPDIHLDLTPLQSSDILSDLAQRDFTVNAMALPLAARAQWLTIPSGQRTRLPDLIDPFHGRQHLLARQLVAVGPETFRDDPGRIVRAARLGARYGLRLDAETLRLAQEAVPLLSSLSADRQREEIALLLALPTATNGLESLNAIGALTTLFPGLRDDAVSHTLETLRQLDRLIDDSSAAATYPALGVWTANDTQRIALRRAMLAHAIDAHDGAPADSNGTLWRQALAMLEIESASERLHAARLLFLRAGKHEAAAVNALLVAVACVFARDDRPHGMALAARAEALIDAYLHDRQSLIPAPLLGGKDLMESLGLLAGPAIGQLLHAVRLAQLTDEITNREEALAFTRRLSLSGTNFTASASD